MNKCRFIFFLFFLATYSCKEIDAVDDNDSFIIDTDLPSYYSKQYLLEKCTLINKSITDVQGSAESFVFITDTHFERNSCHSGQLINSVINNTSVNKVIHGGDAGSELSYDFEPIGFSLLTSNINKLSETLVGKIRPASFYSIRGNHDFNCKIDKNTFDGYPVTFVRDLYLSYMPNVNYDATDDNGFYYFFDNDEKRIRYIAVDTSYGSIIGTGNLGYRQLKWVLEEAINSIPDDYSIVFITHMPITPVLETTGSYVLFKPLKIIIEALNNKRKGSVFCEEKELTYDFTTKNNHVLFVLSGHIHCDGQAFDDNVLYICTTCDRVINGVYSQFPESSNQIREVNSITEQAFDVVSFNKSTEGWILMTRIGAGYSRFFNKEVISVKIGDSIVLNDRLSFVYPVKWNGNDSPGPIGCYNKDWIRSLTVLDINAGKITAKKEGEAIVYAEDKDNNKEFFFIKVTI